MATIELFAAKINMMPDLINEAKRAVLDYKTELESIRSKALAIDSSALDLSEIIASVKASTEILDRKAESLGELGGRVEQFIADVVRIDQGVAELIRLRKKQFYDAHPNLKPDSEKTGWERLCDGLASVGQWCKEHWKLIVVIVLVIAAIVILVFFPFAAPFILKAAMAVIIGAVVGGLMGGATSVINGGSFWEGAEDGAFAGVMYGLLFSGLGVLGSLFGEAFAGVCAVVTVVKYTSIISGIISLGMAGFDLLAVAFGLIDPDNPLTALNFGLHQSTAYNTFQFVVSAIAVFTGSAYTEMRNAPKSCFVAGTLVAAEAGMVAIESIKAGDLVASTDPETMEKSYKRVLETYVREVSRLVHLTVSGALISTTSDHPFYVQGRGFVDAGYLAVGDDLIGEGGVIYPVEHIYLEITDHPVTVYNFQVEQLHTYHVSEFSILVHNASNYNPDEYIDINKVRDAGKPGSQEWKAAVKEIKAGQGKHKPSINFKVETESQAVQLIQEARPNLELRPTYVQQRPASGFEMHPDIESYNGYIPHVKWYDWAKSSDSTGKGHIFYDIGGK